MIGKQKRQKDPSRGKSRDQERGAKNSAKNGNSLNDLGASLFL